jgi:GWxTD domain-containing protein
MIRVSASDSLGARSGYARGRLSIPYIANGVISPLFPFFAAEPRSSREAPVKLIANPRSTVWYGRDSTIQLYIEGYGREAPDSLVLTTRRDRDFQHVLRRDTVALPVGSEVRAVQISIPVARLGLGHLRIVASRLSGRPVGSAVAMVRVGEDLPVTSVDELIDALQFFATESELRPLRSAAADERPALWSEFVSQTDPDPGTPENEALEKYFRRLSTAQAKYREDQTFGWQSDRGSVEVALGDPDEIIEAQPADTSGVARHLTWAYHQYRLELHFYDPTGYGRWRLTNSSEEDFRSLLTLAGPCVGCR